MPCRQIEPGALPPTHQVRHDSMPLPCALHPMMAAQLAAPVGAALPSSASFPSSRAVGLAATETAVLSTMLRASAGLGEWLPAGGKGKPARTCSSLLWRGRASTLHHLLQLREAIQPVNAGTTAVHTYVALRQFPCASCNNRRAPGAQAGQAADRRTLRVRRATPGRRGGAGAGGSCHFSIFAAASDHRNLPSEVGTVQGHLPTWTGHRRPAGMSANRQLR